MIAFAFLAQTLRIAIPYIFAASGGVISERSGLIALGLEGYMLAGAFCAALASYYSGSPWIGLLGAAGGGVAVALLYADDEEVDRDSDNHLIRSKSNGRHGVEERD
ncbi:MAG TPA: hypothetical protein VII52_10665, partial [Gemmatimonadaceae bacterium]